jgi:hypothetical protein
MIIREAKLADAEAIARVQVNTWRTTVSVVESLRFLTVG